MKLIVEGMHCENCVRRIEKAFKKARLPAKVSLKDKTVEIPSDVERAKALLEELGFGVEEQKQQ